MTAAATVLTLRAAFGERPFRVQDAVERGIGRHTLYRLRDRGALLEVSRGVMQLSTSGPSSHIDLVAVSVRAPHATICLNSSLAFWELTDELPDRVHLAVPRGQRPPRIEFPATTVHTFSAETFEVDRIVADTDVEQRLNIYTPERSVVDAMRLSHLVGSDLALGALKTYLGRSGAQPAQLLQLARSIGGERRIRAALETLLA
jgi:predicted transcriptional regulator of viral defense system